MPNSPHSPPPDGAAAATAAPAPDQADQTELPLSARPKESPAHPLHRRLKSFVTRNGRTTGGQAKAFQDFGSKFLLPYRAEPLGLALAFGRHAPTVLEIGFGMGEATAHIATVLPETNFLCCEVHQAGVGKLLKRCGEQDIRNIRIVAHDAVDVLDHMLTPGTLAGIHVFFPDPWHKKRHNKRRLLQTPLVNKLAQRLAPGGYLHCATDWQPYAQQMLEVLGAEPLLANTANSTDGGYAPKPAYRPLTKFENRGLKLGHGVWDLIFTRI